MFSRLSPSFRPWLSRSFFLHDAITDFIGRQYLWIKRILLWVSCLPFLLWVIPQGALFLRDAGSLAGNLLIGVLFLSPLSVIFRMRFLLLLMGLRREFGILMGALAIAHGVGYMFDPMFVHVYIAGQDGIILSSVDKSILAGLIGLVFITLLFITSNRLSLTWLGSKHWKRLHRLVYLAFFFIVLHRFFRVGGSWTHIGPFIDSILLISAYVLLKFLAWKEDTFLAFREIIAEIAHQYAEYRLEITQKNISQ